MKLLWSLAIVFIWVATAHSGLKTEFIEYKHGDKVLEGYLAYDEAVTEKRPGVMVVHEWTGINDYIKMRTEKVAKLGYIAFAADIYGKGIRPKNPEEAAAQANFYRADRGLLRSRAHAGLEVLREHKLTDNKWIAAIGYCFGGTTVLELARSGADIAGVVSFHGGLDTQNPADAKNIKGEVLALHGADDPFVPPEKVTDFQNEMRLGNVNWQMNLYGDAVHSFTNPAAGTDKSKGSAYNEQADKRSWEAMKLFLAEIFKQ